MKPTDLPPWMLLENPRALAALDLCQAYANPLRGRMILSSTELHATQVAARLLRGKPQKVEEWVAAR